MPGKFIAMEGLDGSGLTTQATLLRNHFISKGKDALLTKEPTDGLIGGIIKACLRGEWKTDPLTLQRLFAADRSPHIATEIEPALKNDKTVICDRYVLSTLAFGGIYAPLDILKQINIHFRKPNMVIFVETHPSICVERMKKARHHVELFEEEQKLTQIRRNYISLKRHFSETYTVDGNRPPEDIHAEIKKIVEENL